MNKPKKGFLKPIEILVVTLLSTTAVPANATLSNVRLNEALNKVTTENANDHIKTPETEQLLITPSATTMSKQLMAQHYSHYSHSSHYSHTSHYSHYSSSW